MVCSLGDASCTEGEVSEAIQMATLKKLPIIFFVQDNEWDISANTLKEIRAQDMTQFAKGFNHLNISLDGSNYMESYAGIQEAIKWVK